MHFMPVRIQCVFCLISSKQMIWNLISLLYVCCCYCFEYLLSLVILQTWKKPLSSGAWRRHSCNSCGGEENHPFGGGLSRLSEPQCCSELCVQDSRRLGLLRYGLVTLSFLKANTFKGSSSFSQPSVLLIYSFLFLFPFSLSPFKQWSALLLPACWMWWDG